MTDVIRDPTPISVPGYRYHDVETTLWYGVMLRCMAQSFVPATRNMARSEIARRRANGTLGTANQCTGEQGTIGSLGKGVLRRVEAPVPRVADAEVDDDPISPGVLAPGMAW
ncbi:MAG: hypothetical protein NVS2B16_21480 [Chloroflexota bacterium]